MSARREGRRFLAEHGYEQPAKKQTKEADQDVAREEDRREVEGQSEGEEAIWCEAEEAASRLEVVRSSVHEAIAARLRGDPRHRPFRARRQAGDPVDGWPRHRRWASSRTTSFRIGGSVSNLYFSINNAFWVGSHL